MLIKKIIGQPLEKTWFINILNKIMITMEVGVPVIELF